MDEYICCLLGICCPQAERRERVVNQMALLGADAATAERIADDLIARIDDLLTGGNIVAMIAKAAREHKEK